jgi:hypothetical protein
MDMWMREEKENTDEGHNCCVVYVLYDETILM